MLQNVDIIALFIYQDTIALFIQIMLLSIKEKQSTIFIIIIFFNYLVF